MEDTLVTRDLGDIISGPARICHGNLRGEDV